tara:strand:- start:8 stop:1378 length:1371 start_codon:yes stop_codon:yes gene_type:complete
MPSIRIGFSTDFNLVGEQVGIGTTNPAARLEVAGPILADNTSGGGGISTLTRYDGFLQPDQRVINTVSIAETTKGNLNSLSGEIKIEGEVTVESGTTITGGRLDSLTATDKFAVPLGETNNRDLAPEAGTTRFNQDFGTLEFFDGVTWKTVNSYSRGGAAGRAVFGGGYSTAGTNVYNTESVNIMSLGNGISFGDLVLTAKYSQAACADATRGLFVGGQSSVDMEYITIASAGNSIDFGNSTANGNHNGALSSSTRGIRGGGYVAPANSDVIDYVEIQTLGNAIDFGNLLEGNYGLCGFSSPTRGIFAGGRGDDTPLGQTRINVITISSKGDATRFGDMSARHSYVAGFSNSVRGLITGGTTPDTDIIQYVTFASEGNAQYFGDLTVTKEGACSGNSANQVRGICAGGVRTSPAAIKLVDYVNIVSTGNALEFGELSTERGYGGACSDSHGGLGGF